MAARRAHNPKVVGSNPTPATKLQFGFAFGVWVCIRTLDSAAILLS